jgi:hypothetical protein
MTGIQQIYLYIFIPRPKFQLILDLLLPVPLTQLFTLQPVLPLDMRPYDIVEVAVGLRTASYCGWWGPFDFILLFYGLEQRFYGGDVSAYYFLHVAHQYWYARTVR